jgi:hypothetical protein
MVVGQILYMFIVIVKGVYSFSTYETESQRQLTLKGINSDY